MKKVLGAVVCVLSLATTAEAYTPPVMKSPTGKKAPTSSDARECVRKMAEACKDAMKETPSAVDIDEGKFQTYIVYREWADKLEPGMTTYDASVDQTFDVTPTKFVPKCDKFFAEYTAGTGAVDKPVSKDCEPRVKPFFGFATEHIAAVKAKKGKVTTARADVEHLRLALFGKFDMGYVVPRCNTNDRFKKAFAPFKKQYDDLDAALVPLETAAGLKFVPVVETAPSPTMGMSSLTLVHYVDLKTGKPVESP